MNLILKLIAKLTKGKLVILQDFELDEYVSIAYPSMFDPKIYQCFLYPLARVGGCMLLPDGTVDKRSKSSYVNKWKFL